MRLGPKGVEEVLGLGNLSDYEKKCLEAMKKELMDSIKKGVDFVNSWCLIIKILGDIVCRQVFLTMFMSKL